MLVSSALACCAGLPAPALARTADCPAAPAATAISVRGTITEGNATGRFERTIDLRSGFSKTVRHNGVEESLEGFNGIAWGFSNGIRNVVDVPTLIPISAARAFVSRLGWNDAGVRPSRVTRAAATIVRTYDLPRMARVTVASGPDVTRPSRVIVAGDWGDETTTLSDWRCVANVVYPFVQTTTDTTGGAQTVRISSVQATHSTRETFDAPRSQVHGRIERTGAAPFRFAGKRDLHIIVDGTIGGITMPLIFDTGGANYFGPATAQKMGWSASGGMTINGVGNGYVAGGFARIPEMTIANATLSNEVAVVAPLPWPENAAAPGGMAGWEFLAEFRTTIDYPNKTIAFANFTDPIPAGGTRIPLATDGHTPVAEASVNGVSGWFGVDTGDGSAITLFKAFAAQARVAADSSLKQTLAGGAGGTSKLSQARVQTFSIGGISIANARVHVSEATAGAFASRALAGNLGGGLLHCFRVTFDYRARAMWLFSVPSTQTCLEQIAGT